MLNWSEQVRLVPMSDEHLATTFAWLHTSPDLRRKVDCLAPPSKEGNRAYWHAKWSQASREDYAITFADTHVGNGGLVDIDQARRKAELWIYLGLMHGQGIGRIALTHLLSRAFDGLSLNRVFLRVVADNPRAVDFYGAAGFVKEGICRADTIHDGVFVDSILMSLLVDAFHSARGDNR